jgi:hypothetical protein
MQRISVSSSNVDSVGYDAQTQTLEVAFKSGDIYQYSGVPTNVYEAIMSASSVGSYLHQHVYPHYPATKL